MAVAFSDYLNTLFAGTLPDYAQLGGRLFMADGRNPVIAHDGNEKDDRIMGCFPQLTLAAPELAEGTVLAASADYTYGVRRVVRLGALEVPSSMTTVNLHTGETDLAPTLTVAPYEFPAAEGALWGIHYQVWRSKANLPLVLYLVDELTAEEYAELDDGAYADTTTDENLSAAATYDLNDPETNQFLYPVRYLRTWKGRLIAAGSHAYTEGTVTVDAEDLDTVTVNAPGALHPADVGAYVWIADEPTVRMIASVDPEAGTFTIDLPCSIAHTESAWYLFRDFETVYVLNPLPGNIEGYAFSEEVISNQGTNDRVTGIAVNAGYCLILRRNSINILDGSAGAWELLPHPASPPGCVCHATIADRHPPFVLYYAGEAGVVMLRGSEARIVSDKVQQIIDTEVDHSQDHWTHAVYDPNTGLYWLWLFGKDWSDYGIRIPQLVLIYDTIREQWYRAELAASRSGLWSARDGRMIPVVGLAGGVARLDWGLYDGAAIAGVIDDTTEPWSGEGEPPEGWPPWPAAGGATINTLYVPRQEFPTAGVGVAGCPIHVQAPDGSVQRRIIKSNTAWSLVIQGAWTTIPEPGWTYRIGSIRWHAETGEVGFRRAFDEEKKVEAVAVAHDQDTAAHDITLRVSGVRAEASREHELAVALQQGDARRFAGAQVGLRAKTVTLRVEGDGLRAVKVLGLAVQQQPVKRTD